MKFTLVAGQTTLAAVLLMLTACTKSPPPEPAPFQLVTNITDTMEWILEPAADVIWDSAGFIITAEGEEDLSPDTTELWAEVVWAAATLSESGNLLMLPGRSPGGDWDEYARGLVSSGTLALEAAQAQDAEALFDAGGRIYQVCRACHNQYWPEARTD